MKAEFAWRNKSSVRARKKHENAGALAAVLDDGVYLRIIDDDGSRARFVCQTAPAIQDEPAYRRLQAELSLKLVGDSVSDVSVEHETRPIGKRSSPRGRKSFRAKFAYKASTMRKDCRVTGLSLQRQLLPIRRSAHGTALMR